jgi:hypothetical protein
MASPDLISIVPPESLRSSITKFLDVNIGPNITVYNNNSRGVDLGNLQLKTKSILSSSGINVSPDSVSGSSNLTISKDGEIDTVGSIFTSSSLNSASLNVGNNNMTVSDTGLVYAANDLTIGSKFKVTASTGAVTAGTMTINGGFRATETITIGGTVESPAISLANNGEVYISGPSVFDNNLSVSGASSFADTLDVAKATTLADTLAVAKAVAFADTLAVTKATTLSDTLAVAKSTTLADTLDVAKSVTFADTLAVAKASSFADTLAVAKAATLADTLDVTKDLSVGGVGNKVVVKADTGSVSTFLPYSSYTPNVSSSNTDYTIHSTTSEDVFFGSSTNNLLTTQEYVDKQIWNQTKRINTILGKDSNELDNFNKVYDVITKIAGDSELVRTLKDTNDKYGTLVDKTNEINTSMSDIVSFAHNDVLVRCSRSVWADECPPVPIPSTVSHMGEGWYFRNFAQGQKINYYLPTNGVNMTVNDIQQLCLNIFAVSNRSLPFITFYTAPKNNATDLWSGIVNARVNYMFSAPTTPTSNTANTSYCLYTSDDAPMNIYNTTPVKNSSISTVNSTNKQTYSLSQSIDPLIVQPTDKIVFFAINTDSGSSANNVEFIINSLNLCLKSGTTRFLFTNSSVATNYLFNSSFKKHSDFTSMNAKEVAYLASYSEAFIQAPSTN